MNNRKAKELRRKAKDLYANMKDVTKEKTSEKRTYNWLKKLYKSGEKR